jgi:hypothetical protein
MHWSAHIFQRVVFSEKLYDCALQSAMTAIFKSLTLPTGSSLSFVDRCKAFIGLFSHIWVSFYTYGCLLAYVSLSFVHRCKACIYFASNSLLQCVAVCVCSVLQCVEMKRCEEVGVEDKCAYEDACA